MSGWPSYRSPSRLMKSRWRSSDDRIVHVGDRQRCHAVVIRHEFPAADLLEPVGMVRTALVGRAAHDPECQLLPGFVRFLQHLVQESVVDLARLRLQFTPTPTGVMDGGRNPGRQVLVLLAGPVERLPAHAWVGEDFVRFFWGDDNLLAVDQASHHPHHDECHADPFHKWFLEVHCFCFQARTYSTLKVDGRSLSSGIPNHCGMVSESKIRNSGWCQCVFSTERTRTPST